MWETWVRPLGWEDPLEKGMATHSSQCMKVKSESEIAQLCPTLSDPMDCSPPGSPVPGILDNLGLYGVRMGGQAWGTAMWKEQAVESGPCGVECGASLAGWQATFGLFLAQSLLPPLSSGADPSSLVGTA